MASIWDEDEKDVELGTPNDSVEMFPNAKETANFGVKENSPSEDWEEDRLREAENWEEDGLDLPEEQADAKLAAPQNSFESIQKSIKIASIAKVIVGSIGVVGLLFFYVLIEVSDSIPAILISFAVFIGIIAIWTFVDRKLSKKKSEAFKRTIVLERLSRKCEMKAYQIGNISYSEVFGFGFSASNQFSSDDYVRGKYKGHAFKFWDGMIQSGNNKVGNAHAFVIELPKTLDGNSVHFGTKRIFSGCIKAPEHDSSEIMEVPGFKKKFVISHGYKHRPALTMTDLLQGAASIENVDASNSVPREHLSKPTYSPNQLLTRSVGNQLLALREMYPRDKFDCHFEEDHLIFVKTHTKNFFEPHFKYGFLSREAVNAAVDAEMNTVFKMFDNILPLLNDLFPYQT